jgi:eukaryotic-like serine/threonine-protein kinase
MLVELRRALQDEYRVESEVGRGGMATVFKATDLKHGRIVAIKVLSTDLSATISADRFQREIQIAARLQHPHILPMHDSGTAGGLLYYVMPFVEGESLRERLRREGQLPIEMAVEIATEVADALAYAHRHGVVHRDIKPENILLSQGHAIVADFGIAHAVDQTDADRLTRTGTTIGSVTYMSPEQFSGEQVDGRSDVYSLGCTLYEMLVGEVPFTGTSARSVMARAAKMDVPPIHIVRDTVPESLEAIVMRSLQKSPADRFQTMDDFHRALRGEQDFVPTLASTARHTQRYPARRVWWRTPRAALVGAAALLALAGALTTNALNRPTTPAVDANKLAILYFADRSSAGELRYLGDALTESLIEQLVDVPGLDVVSRAGVEQYRGRDLDKDSVASIAERLHVGSVVRGSVEPSGRGVRVNVALLDASGAEVDYGSFEHPTTSALALRDTVSQQVAEFLRERLGRELVVRARRARTGNVEAWLAAQRAERRRKDSERLFALDSAPAALRVLGEADSMLAAAEQVDPRWPDAPAMRALIAHRRARALRADRAAARVAADSGLARANRALALDPRSVDALEARGTLRYLLATQRLIDDASAPAAIDSAERDLLSAVRWRPSQATAWVTLSSLYYRKHDFAEAKNAAVRAYQADAYLSAPDLILPRLFWTNYDQELFGEASRWCDEGRRRFAANPFFFECQLWLQTAPKGISIEPDRAWALRDSMIQHTSPASRQFASRKAEILVAGALARANLADSARRVLLHARLGAGDVDPERELVGFEAAVRVMLGDRSEAVRLIKAYLALHPDHRTGFAQSTGWWWRDLQTDPEFRRLVQAT